MEAFEILIIILSVTLSIFLLAAIILVVQLLKLVRKVRELSEQAEQVAHNLSDISDTVRRNIKPAMIGSALYRVIRKTYQRNKKET